MAGPTNINHNFELPSFSSVRYLLSIREIIRLLFVGGVLTSDADVCGNFDTTIYKVNLVLTFLKKHTILQGIFTELHTFLKHAR